MKSFYKKGFMEPIKTLAIGLAVIAIVLALGFLILSQLKTNILSQATALGVTAAGNNGENLTGWNSTNTLIQGLATIPGWISILIVVFIGAIMIGAVMYFGRNRM